MTRRFGRLARHSLPTAVSLPIALALGFAACGEQPLPELAPGPSSAGTDGGAAPDADGGPGEVGLVVLGGKGPHLRLFGAVPLPVPEATEPRAPLGFAVNAVVHSRGKPTRWRVEYGPTPAYGASTDERPLPPALSAHLEESWTLGPNGWSGGFSGSSLAHVQDATSSYLRFTDRLAEEDDTNHVDGIGVVHLPLYGYVGNAGSGEVDHPSLFMGGGHPDLRGARFSLLVRGTGWVGKKTTLATWVQATLDTRGGNESAMSNWANTGSPFGGLLASGTWQLATWTLRNLTTEWTYAGQHGVRNYYLYKELDRVLGDVNVDLFPAQLIGVESSDLPSGSIDFDELAVTYRNHSVLVASNGGHLVPEDADATTSRLTDGWRTGTDRDWESAAAPAGPRRFLYRLDRPVSLRSVVVHNSSRFPSADVRLRVSVDGQTFVDLGTQTLPAPGRLGPNHLFAKFEATDEDGRELLLHQVPVRFVEVSVLSGRFDTRWGLGEIEAFGDGALETPDDTWDDVNRDVLVAPGTYHFRIVATNEDGVTVGPDQTVEVKRPGPPSIEAVLPSEGPRAGGTDVFLHGEGLADTQAVSLCGRQVRVTGAARRLVLIETPPGTNTCDVQLVTPYGRVDVPGAFTFR